MAAIDSNQTITRVVRDGRQIVIKTIPRGWAGFQEWLILQAVQNHSNVDCARTPMCARRPRLVPDRSSLFSISAPPFCVLYAEDDVIVRIMKGRRVCYCRRLKK